MDLPTSGQGDDRSRSGGGGDVCPLTPEYHRPVYCHLVDTRPMSGEGATGGITDDFDMSGEGRP